MRGTRQVPFFDYRRAFAARRAEILALVDDVIERGAFILQADVARFERALADYVGCAGAVGTGNCTDALTLALRAVGIGPGDEVLVPTHTMVATAGAVVAVGAVPVPVDIGPDGLIDPRSLDAAVTPRAKAVIPVHLNGRTCDMGAVGRVAQRHGLFVVEDAAQALGARWAGRAAGTFGSAGCFSFYPAKALGCLGDGGALVTDDPEVERTVRRLRDHGRDADGEVTAWGRNSRLDNLHAAVLHLLLPDHRPGVERRRELARRYHAGLGGLDGLHLPPGPDADAQRFDVFQNYEVQAESRDGLRTHLAEWGIGALVQWGGKPLHRIHALGMSAEMPGADAYFKRCIMLPMNTSLCDSDIDYVCEAVHAFYGV